jgi:hypothetical protein
MATPYLGNSHTKEIHDMSKTVPACEIEKIKEDHKVPIWSYSEVLRMCREEDYNGCAHCLSPLDTG